MSRARASVEDVEQDGELSSARLSVRARSESGSSGFCSRRALARAVTCTTGASRSQSATTRSPGKRPRLGELKARLVGLKKGDCPWLYEVSAHIGQQALHDLDRAFERFFKGLKGDGPKSGYPRFKRKGERNSARLYEVRLDERHVRLADDRPRQAEGNAERAWVRGADSLRHDPPAR